MAKQIIYDSAAKEKILAGVNKLEKAVSATLGPCGKNVIIDEYGAIHSTKDGVSVAKSIVLKDKFENLGANAIKEVAENSSAGVSICSVIFFFLQRSDNFDLNSKKIFVSITETKIFFNEDFELHS